MIGGDRVITQANPSYYTALRYAEYRGLSTDDKAQIDAKNADAFYEIDTGKWYRYDEMAGQWIAQ